jgi:hypothetical protein
MSDFCDEESINMVEEFECPYCTTKFQLDLSQEEYETEDEEREMGPEILYQFDIEHECPVCRNLIGIEGYISEYPQGAYNDSNFNIEKLSDINLVSNNDIEYTLEKYFKKDRLSYSNHFEELITDYVDDVESILNKSCDPVIVDDICYYEEEFFNSIIDKFVGSKQAEYLNS